jgi:hypothetical protein
MDHYRVAMEHLLWAREAGFSLADICEAVGEPVPRLLTTETVVGVLARAHRGLQPFKAGQLPALPKYGRAA